MTKTRSTRVKGTAVENTSRFKAWPITLLLTIASFSIAVFFLFLLIQEIHMETILDFFNIFASAGVYGAAVSIFFLAGTILLVITIILGALKK